MKKAISIALSALLLFAAGFWNAAFAGDAPRPYIVVFEQRPVRALRSLSASPAADPAALVKEQLQDRIRESYPLIDGALADLTEAEAAELAAQPGVALVEPDYPVHALAQTVPWGVERIYEEEVYPFDTWATSSGAGIRIAVLDSGIQGSHEDLPALAGGVTIVDSSLYTVDGKGHGTHVAGIIAAQMNQLGVVGVAPAASLYSVKVLSNTGGGSVSGIIAGIQWAVAHDADIISMSLGTESYSESLKSACDAAWTAGCLLVAAAGNSGNAAGTGANMEYPARFSSVIAVGATDSSDQRASFSSTGAELELMAPGDNILSTYPSNSLVGRVELADAESTFDLSSTPLVDSGVGAVTGPAVFCGDATNEAVVLDALSARGITEGQDWIALIDRRDITFAQKVLLVMNKGAKAAVIMNNDTTDPEDEGTFTLDDGVTTKPPGGWVPTVSISYNAGQMIRSSADLSGTVEVKYDAYTTMRGTSMATPHVSAAAAVLWSQSPSLSNAQIREILSATALDLGLLDSQEGRGLIQLNAALDLAADVESGRALALAAPLRHDPETGHVEADLELRILPGPSARLLFALYDDSGRMAGCSVYSIEVAAYKQTLTVSADYNLVRDPVKCKAFLVTDGFSPLGIPFEALLP